MTPRTSAIGKELVKQAARLRDESASLRFRAPVEIVYNPLVYAWKPHKSYLERFGGNHKRVIFLGMNPGPWGMAQTGVPFGAVSIVRSWLGIEAPVKRPEKEHPSRPINGFQCEREEVSGNRLWGLFREHFGTAEAFFSEHFVVNYCPLIFFDGSAKNCTPDKLKPAEREALGAVCDRHLREVAELLQPDWVVGVGAYAESRAKHALASTDVRIGRILHPSPASPAANKGWAGLATKQLMEQGVWE